MGRKGVAYAAAKITHALAGPSEMTSDKPLTLGEMADFFLGAWSLIEVLEMNFEGDLEPALGASLKRSLSSIRTSTVSAGTTSLKHFRNLSTKMATRRKHLKLIKSSSPRATSTQCYTAPDFREHPGELGSVFKPPQESAAPPERVWH
jgi:hypothetical protein